MGVSLTQFFVENISLPPEVEQALDKRSQMGVLGQPRPVHEVPDGRGDPRRGEEPRRAWRRRGADRGAGVAVGQQVAGSMGTGSLPPPLPQQVAFFMASQRTAGRPVRSGIAGGTGEGWIADARNPGMASGDGRMDAGGVGSRVAESIRVGAAAIAAPVTPRMEAIIVFTPKA